MARSKKRVLKTTSPWEEAILRRFEEAVTAPERLPRLLATDEESALAEMECLDPVPFIAIWENKSAKGISLSIAGSAIEAFLFSQGVAIGHRRHDTLKASCGERLKQKAGEVFALADHDDGRLPRTPEVSFR